ncbi:MAG: energy transducer TonB [Bryobacteraceae bacterium]
MSARPRPAPFGVSLLTHGLILAWLAAGPVSEEPKSLYAQTIAPHASKLVWYNFREKLPDVSPVAAPKPSKPPRADVKAAQEIVAAAAKAQRAKQFVWQPAPKLELRTDLQSPNVLAIHAPRPEPPPKPKLFVPPPDAPPPSGEAPMLAAPPEIRTARNIRGDLSLPAMQPAKAPPRTFVPPPVAMGDHAKPSPFGAPLPEPPALPDTASPSAVSMAIVGLSPSVAPAPAPEGSRSAQFSAGPQTRPTGGTDSSVEGAILTVPGLLIRSGPSDAKPARMARASPTSAENLRAAVRSSLPATSIAGPHPAGAGGVLTLPVPLRKVDPKYFPGAVADRVEGNVRLAAVIRKDGRVESVRLLRRLDDRLDQSAQEAMAKWQFEPALRDGRPVEVDALIEIPFRLAPPPKR